MNTRNFNSKSVSRPSSVSASSSYIPPARRVLSPGEWVRAVSGFDAPFGFDRMPTVFG